MSFMTEDGKHEGWVAALFHDALSVGSGPEGFLVKVNMYPADRAADGDVEPDDWRSHEAAIGWIGACTCGWRSAPWTRAAKPTDEDLAARRAFGDFVWIDGAAVTDFDPANPPGPVLFDIDHRAIGEITHAEWKQHIEPDRLLAQIADLTAQRHELDERLAKAVAQARAVNATWEDIGRAAGITRQSAHERWSRTAATSTS
jgi:hypothetical protein